MNIKKLGLKTKVKYLEERIELNQSAIMSYSEFNPESLMINHLSLDF